MQQVYLKRHNPTFRYANNLLQNICTNKYLIERMGTLNAESISTGRASEIINDGGGSDRITGFQEFSGCVTLPGGVVTLRWSL